MKNLVFGITISAFAFLSCKDPDTSKEDYNRAPMLENIADNIIIPNYEALQNQLGSFQASIDSLNTNMNQQWLDSVKTNWLEACKKWQHCKVFEFGPASDIALRTSMNTFPTDTALIESNISSGSYTLGAVGNIQAIGFPAFDYLLYADSDANTLNRVMNSPNFRQYLVDLADKMLTDVNFVTSQWNTSYRNSFIASTGTASGSSTNDLYNEMVYDLELIKNAKYGIPLGKDILDVPRPTYVEAYYSGYSNTFALENMHSIENVFLGRSIAGTDGIGFDDYLDYCEAKRGSQDLSVVIKNQFNTINTELTALPNPLSDALLSNYAQINDVYFSIKDQVLYMKTDMSSALGLIIEYFDNDGD